AAADASWVGLGWTKPYHVDADHILLETVDRFIPLSDFFTIDVADFIGRPPEASSVRAFVARHHELVGRVEVPGIDPPLRISRADVERVAAKYLFAVQEAGRIYCHIEQAKDRGALIAEVSLDETGSPQTTPELLVFLAASAAE